jgi:hypothetical protein
MIEQNILDALNNVVQAANTIRVLTSELISNPQTQQDIDSNIQTNVDLRQQKSILNTNNKVLFDNKLDRIDIQSAQYDDNGYVIAPWPFSNEIVGTSQYYVDQNPPDEVTQEQIRLENDDLRQLFIFKQNQYNALKNTIRLKTDMGENTDAEVAELLQIEQTLLELRNSIDINSDVLIPSKDMIQSPQTPAQIKRSGLESDLRAARRNINDKQKQIDVKLKEIELVKMELANYQPNTPSYIFYKELLETKNLELQTLINEKTEFQLEEDSINTELELFLESPESNGTTPTSLDKFIIDAEYLTDSEKVAIQTLHRQIMERINTAPTLDDMRVAYQELSNLDIAIREQNVERIVLDAPQTDSLDVINGKINELIQERDVLQNELNATPDTDIQRIEELQDQLSDNFQDRLVLYRQLYTIQDGLLGFGVKVRVVSDENGNPVLQSFDTIPGQYQKDPVYSKLNPKDKIQSQSLGVLTKEEHLDSRFVMADEVFDTKTGRRVKKSQAEAGNEARYINIRPLITDVEAYLSDGLNEVNNIEKEFRASKIYKDYNAALSAVKEPFRLQLNNLNTQLDGIFDQIQTQLANVGLNFDDYLVSGGNRRLLDTERLQNDINKLIGEQENV